MDTNEERTLMSRIIRFVLMVQFLIFVTMAAQTPAEASGGPVCVSVMCNVESDAA